MTEMANRADQFIVLEHRDAHDRPVVAQVNRGAPLRIVSMRPNVVDLDHLFRGGSTPESSSRRRSEKQLASACLCVCGRRGVQCNCTKQVSFAEPKRAEFGLTNVRGIRQHRLEHWL